MTAYVTLSDIRQSQQETEMRLDMNKGSGSIIIRDADIQSLQRYR